MLIKKETQTQVFSCEYCKIFKNTYFEEYLRTTASLFIKGAQLTKLSSPFDSRIEERGRKIGKI